MRAERKTLEPERDFLLCCIDSFRSKLARQSVCRQCSEPSAWKDDVCRVCGAQDPVRLPVTWLFWLAGGLVLVTIALLVVC
jgi:hypothetical protein